MKALKILATVVLTAIIAATGLAAEALALVRFTALEPSFFGQPERGAYQLASEAAVREFSRLVLEAAPANLLRTTDPDEAYALAARAMPPEKLATALESTAPEVAGYLLQGGNVPVLQDYMWLRDSQQELVKSLLKPGVWELMPSKPELPVLVPFTPKWNTQYGQSLEYGLILPRFYYGVYDNTLLAVATAALGANWLLFLLWKREKKPFYLLTGTLFVLNSLLLLLPAVAISFFIIPLVRQALASGVIAGLDAGLAAALPAMVRAALWPFRGICFYAFLVTFSFGITQLASGIVVKKQPSLPAKKNIETL